MNTLVDVSKLGSISVVKKLNSLLNKVLGLRLFYRLDLEAGKNILENKEALKKLFGSSSNMLAKDLKKAISNRELIISSVSSHCKRAILPVMVRKKVYGFAITDELGLEKSSASNEKIANVLNDEKIKELCSFLEEFINFIFSLKFEEIVF